MHMRSFLPGYDPDESIYVFVRPYFLAITPWFGIQIALMIVGIIMIILTMVNFPELVDHGLGHNILVIISSAYFLSLIPFSTVIFISYYYDIHIVTDHRLVDIDQHGLFNREVNELALEDVQDVSSMNRGILSSVFDFGDVIIETAGAQPRFEFLGVRHPRDIAAIILDLSVQSKENVGLNHRHIEPKGTPKGVIDGNIYESTDPLIKMGAVVPPGGQAPPNERTFENPAPKTALPTHPPGPSVPTKPPSPDDLDITIDEPK